MREARNDLQATLYLGKPRTWRERLFSLPWRPFRRFDSVAFTCRSRKVSIERIIHEGHSYDGAIEYRAGHLEITITAECDFQPIFERWKWTEHANVEYYSEPSYQIQKGR